MSLASHTSHAAHSVQMSAWKCWRQEKKMKQAIRCSKSLLSRQNKEKKKTPASPTYPCRTPTRFLGKTTVSCQGLADNLNLPVQSNHQTQQNKQHRSKPFFFQGAGHAQQNRRLSTQSNVYTKLCTMWKETNAFKNNRFGG